MANKQKKTFIEKIRDSEKKCFSEFTEDNIYAPPNSNYFYFAPSWHFRMGLLTEELIGGIRSDKKQILSVGSGAAYLEKYLVKKLGIKKEQITLSDKDSVLPREFERFIFDMYGNWPKFDKEFDYVIFPESVLLNVRFRNMHQLQQGLCHIIENSLAATKPMGQVRISGHSTDEINLEPLRYLLERNYPGSKIMYSPALIVVEKS